MPTHLLLALPQLFPVAVLARLAPVAHPAAQAWSLFAIGQVAEAVANMEPGSMLPSSLAWSTMEMVLAASICRVLWSVETGEVGIEPSTCPGGHQWRRPFLIGLGTLLIALLAGLVVSHRPTILLPLVGLALTFPNWSAPLRREARA